MYREFLGIYFEKQTVTKFAKESSFMLHFEGVPKCGYTLTTPSVDIKTRPLKNAEGFSFYRESSLHLTRWLPSHGFSPSNYHGNGYKFGSTGDMALTTSPLTLNLPEKIGVDEIRAF